MQNDTNKKRRKFWVKLQQPKPKIIDGKYLIREITDVFFAKSGLLYTIKKMLISPGKSVRHYLREDRKLFVKPIVFLIITSLIYALIDFFLPHTFITTMRTANPDNLQLITPFSIYNITDSDTAHNPVFRWIEEASAYTTILFGLLVAFCVKLFFRKSGYNFFEIFVLLCYVSGISMLFLSAEAILTNLFPHYNNNGLSQTVSTIYLVWAIGQFFNKKQYNIGKKVLLYTKAYASFWLGLFIYFILLATIQELAGNYSFLEKTGYILQWLISFIPSNIVFMLAIVLSLSLLISLVEKMQEKRHQRFRNANIKSKSST